MGPGDPNSRHWGSTVAVVTSTWARRVGAALIALGSAAVLAVLLFSDRAALRASPLRAAIVDAGQWVERHFAIDWIDRTDVPATFDHLAHAAMWGSAMLIVGWILRHRLPVWFVAVAMSGISMVSEFLQPVLTATRSVEAGDAAANIVGVWVAAGALAVTLATLRLLRDRPASMAHERAHW